MIKLLQIDSVSEFGVGMHSYARQIVEFDAIIKRDRGSKGDAQGRVKLRAQKELAFVFFYCDIVESPFASIARADRPQEIYDSLGITEDLLKDPLVKAACKKYKKLNKTKLESLLEFAYLGVDKVESFFEKFDLEEMVAGKPRYSINDMTRTLSQLGKIVTELDTLMESVRKQNLQKDTIRRGVQENEFNMTKKSVVG